MAQSASLPDGCDPALDTLQCAAYTGLSPAYLEKLRCIGGGPQFLKYGRRAVRYAKREVDAWMNARLYSSTSEAAV